MRWADWVQRPHTSPEAARPAARWIARLSGGSPGGVDIGVGYRSELETLLGGHLRARTLLPMLGVMNSVDPLDGVLGTATLSPGARFTGG
jgi:hypothetical protein